jgi:hypothetical protein
MTIPSLPFSQVVGGNSSLALALFGVGETEGGHDATHLCPVNRARENEMLRLRLSMTM